MSGFVAACPELAELTIVSPYPSGAQLTEAGVLLDPAGRARSAISEVVDACKALPDLDVLQLVRIPIVPPPLVCWCRQRGCSSHMPSPEQWEQASEKQMKDLVEWTIDCLKEPKVERRWEEECQEEKEGKRTTLRVVKFGPGRRCVEAEYEV